MPTHPSQHSHLRHLQLLDVEVLNWPTLRSIQHSRSDCHSVELPLTLGAPSYHIIFSLFYSLIILDQNMMYLHLVRHFATSPHVYYTLWI